jgi:hypothetical protein
MSDPAAKPPPEQRTWIVKGTSGDISFEMEITSPSIAKAIHLAENMPGGRDVFVYSAVTQKPRKGNGKP